MDSTVFLITCCLAVIHTTISNHIDESLSLPSAILSPDKTEVVTFNIDAEGNDTTLELSCSGVGDLIWYRGSDPPVKLNNSYITQLTNNQLLLTISPVVNNIDANNNGIPYFCVANNTLGTARSRTVLVKYASFDGFEAENTTTEIVVRIGEAVAFNCGVIAAVPPPSYVWFMNNETINVTNNMGKIRTLDDGATLVIYAITNDDVSVNYTCGVTNARMFDTELSTRIFKLIVNATFNAEFVIYREPQSQIVPNTVQPSDIVFYYIGATNIQQGSQVTRLFGPGGLSLDDATLSATLLGTQLEDRSLFLQLLEGDNAASLEESRINFNLTIIETLTVMERPSNISTIFHRFSNEAVNFTCNAIGTGTQLQWFRNAEKLININSNSLVINNLTVSDSGVYQCFWEGSDDGMFASDTWALSVQQPECGILSCSDGESFNSTACNSQPNSFVLTTDPQSVSLNRTIVPNGTLVSLTMEFIADSNTTVTWFRSDSDSNNISEILFSDTELYNTTGVLETNIQNKYRITFTILSVTNLTSGYYYSIIDDNRTDPVKSPSWFVSIEEPLSIVSVTLSPYNCLRQDTINIIQCIVTGLPDPSVKFQLFSDDVDCTVTDCDTAVNIEGVVTTANLTFGNVSADNEGPYVCVAENTAQADPINKQLFVAGSQLVKYCTSPIINLKSNDSVITANTDTSITLQCGVESIPTISTVVWYKDGVLVEDDSNHIDISTDGILFELELIGVFVNDTGLYVCSFINTAIPLTVNDTINITVLPEVTESSPLPVYIPIAAAVGGTLLLIVLVAIVIILLLCCCLVSSNKNKKGSYTTGVAMRDFTDGRGNVDKDSDEENTVEQPEAFQPQYESLPAIRPTIPPNYKPSPAYNQFNQGDDFDIVKQPLPENDNQTPFNYHPQQFFSGDNGGVAIHGSMMQGLQSQHPMGSSMGLQQARYDDFMSDDEKFV